eukprot:1928484-Rhodomonas_salina.2
MAYGPMCRTAIARGPMPYAMRGTEMRIVLCRMTHVVLRGHITLPAYHTQAMCGTEARHSTALRNQGHAPEILGAPCTAKEYACIPQAGPRVQPPPPRAPSPPPSPAPTPVALMSRDLIPRDPTASETIPRDPHAGPNDT